MLDVIFAYCLPQMIGFMVPWVTILVANSPWIHPGAAALANGHLIPPNAENCTAGSCWDKADKYGYPECTGGAGIRGRVRGAVVESATCYKSIYINIESNSGLAIGVILFFGLFTSRVWEKVAFAIIGGKFRWMVAFSLAASLPSWYYSCKMSFVYVNEYLHLMQRSQMFFTLTETMVMAILTMHIGAADPVHEPALSVGLATSLCHLIQVLLDEQSAMSEGSSPQISRNVLLLLGDAAILAALAHLSASLAPRRRMRAYKAALALLAAEMLLFQLCIADYASWHAFS
jgi:hypothetical protein